MKGVYGPDLKRFNQWDDIMRFLTYYVYVTYCLPGTKFKQSPNLRALNKVHRLKLTACDAYTKWLESHYSPALDMHRFERLKLCLQRAGSQ